jgi:hypothetical protein
MQGALNVEPVALFAMKKGRTGLRHGTIPKALLVFVSDMVELYKIKRSGAVVLRNQYGGFLVL